VDGGDDADSARASYFVSQHVRGFSCFVLFFFELSLVYRMGQRGHNPSPSSFVNHGSVRVL